MGINSRYRTVRIRAHFHLYAAFTLHALSSPRSVQRIISDTLHCMRDRSFGSQRQNSKRVVEPTRASTATPAEEEEACLKRRPSSPVEAQDATTTTLDLQLSLSPTTASAKKRKTSGPFFIDDTSCEFSTSLSLSPPVAAPAVSTQQRQEKTRRSSDDNGGGGGVLGQSTLDLTMSIRALE